jgi:hypothetical protein
VPAVRAPKWTGSENETWIPTLTSNVSRDRDHDPDDHDHEHDHDHDHAGDRGVPHSIVDGAERECAQSARTLPHSLHLSIQPKGFLLPLPSPKREK